MVLGLSDAAPLGRAATVVRDGGDVGDGGDLEAGSLERADRLLAAADHLLRGPVANVALMDECRPWIEAFDEGARAIRRIAELLLDVVKWSVQKALVAVRIEPAPGDGLTVMAADADGTYRY